MANKIDDQRPEEVVERAEWERPELRRLDAADAEAAGAPGSDIVYS